MNRLILAAVLVLLSTAAFGQTRNQAAATAAGVNTRLKSQGYGDIHDLRRMPDGSWTGKATRNGVPVTVTSNPAGTTIAR